MLDLEKLGIGRLSRKTAWVGGAKTLTLLSLVAANIYLARTLGRSEFGLYGQGWLYIHTLVPILLLGIPQAVNYFLPRSGQEKAGLYIRAFFLVLLATGLVGLVLSLTAPASIAALIGNDRFTILLPMLGFYVFFILPSYLLEPVLILKNRVRELFFWCGLFALLFMGIAVWGGSIPSLRRIFLGFALLAVFKTLVILTRGEMLYGGGARRVLPLPSWPELLSFTGVLGAMALVDVLTVQMDKYLVSHFLSPEEFAIYFVGAIEVPLTGLALSAVTAVVMPEVSRLLKEDNRECVIHLLHSSMKKLGVVFLPLFLYCLLTARFYIPFFFTDKYRGSIGIFIIYLFLLPIRSLNNHPYLIGAGLQRYALYGRLIDVVVNFSVGLLLLKWIGLPGPALSTILATYIHKAYQTLVVCRRLGLKPGQVYPWGFLFRTFTVAALCAAPLAILLFLLKWNVVSVLLGSVIFAVTYFLALPCLMRRVA